MRFTIALVIAASALVQANRPTCFADDYPYPNIHDEHSIVKCEEGFEVIEQCPAGSSAMMVGGVAECVSGASRRTCIADDYPYPNIHDEHSIVKCEEGLEVVEQCPANAVAMMVGGIAVCV